MSEVDYIRSQHDAENSVQKASFTLLDETAVKLAGLIVEAGVVRQGRGYSPEAQDSHMEDVLDQMKGYFESRVGQLVREKIHERQLERSRR